MYDGHSLLDVLLTSTLPLLVFRGVLSLRAEKIRFWRLEIKDTRGKTPFVWWRHRPTVKSVRFLPLILRQSVHLCCRKVREHGEWFYIKLQTHLQSLRERTPLLFAISDKHSGRLLNFLCCFLYLELGLYWVIHAWTSDFKLFLDFSRKLKSGIVPSEGHLRTVLKPLGGVTEVFLSPVLIPHSSLPLPNQFSCLSQNTLWKDQESPQNEIRDWNKITK